MSKGLSNFQIDDFYKDEENDDLKNSYMGTYSIDSISKYINFYEIIKKEMLYIHSQFLIQIKKINLAFTGGVFGILIQRIIYFCLILLVSKD